MTTARINVALLRRLQMNLTVGLASLAGMSSEYRKLREDRTALGDDAPEGLSLRMEALQTRMTQITAETNPLSQLVANLETYASAQGVSI